jgi:hypothetical protein
MLPADMSQQYLESELSSISAVRYTFGWDLTVNMSALRVTAELKSFRDDERYVLDMEFDNYKAWPPYLEFREWDTGKPGTKRAYPKGGRGYFHPNLCICAPFNRKAYSRYGGPHGDWNIENWMSLTPTITTLGDILILVQRLLNDPTYEGRMER